MFHVGGTTCWELTILYVQHVRSKKGKDGMDDTVSNVLKAKGDDAVRASAENARVDVDARE